MWDESKHPRDELGRFTAAGSAYRQNTSYREILEAQIDSAQDERALRKVPLDFFSNEKRRTITKGEVAVDDRTYIFPVDLDIKYGSRSLIFDKPIKVEGIITIVKPKNLRDQRVLNRNYGGRYGAWCKKGGNAIVEIGGEEQERQAHWYENTDGKIAKVKIIY